MTRRYVLCLAILVCSLSAQAQPYSSSINDCKTKTSCTANNNASFRNGTLTGARIEFGYIKCSTNTNIGDAVEVCINNDPVKPPEQRLTDCEFECQSSSFGWSYTTYDNDIVIGTTACNSCPAPTPSPPPEECQFQQLEQVSDPSGYGELDCTICQDLMDNDCDGLIDEEEYDCLDCASPIAIDTYGNGFDLTSAAEGVEFDIAGVGSPIGISWIQGDDAWLALDRNGNGFIDSGKELFGAATFQAPSTERNGFQALGVYDLPENGGNGDGAIDRKDGIFNELRVWLDANHNGVSEPSELHSLPSMDLLRLDLNYRKSRRVDEHGNQFRFRSRVHVGRGSDVSRWAWDVFLVRESSTSGMTALQEIKSLFLPRPSLFSYSASKCRG